MISKKVVVDTDQARGQLFRVNESGGRCYVYDYDVGFIIDDRKKIGDAPNLQEAIALIKASVNGVVRNIRIDSW